LAAEIRVIFPSRLHIFYEVKSLKVIKMRMLAFVSMAIFLSACSSIGSGVEVFQAADLGKDGLPKFSKNKSLKGTKSVPPDDEQYVIKPGDQLSVKFFFNPELNEENLIVRPDGRISLQLIHEVEAATLTAPQLTSLLAERYKGQLKNPEIAVIVRAVKEKPSVYVDGQVKRPGKIEIIGSLSVLEAITRSGGFLEDTAKKNEVIVLREDQSGQTFVIKVDIEASLSGEDLNQNIQLHPRDFVQVPRSFF
jgi:protein involved in polysaccharide export with SLBB domain